MISQNRIIIGIAGLILLAGLILAVYSPAIIGRVISEGLERQDIMIEKTFTDNSSFEINVSNSTRIRGVLATGEYTGTGDVRIYLETADGRLLIAEASEKEKATNLLTGFAIMGEEIQSPELVEETDAENKADETKTEMTEEADAAENEMLPEEPAETDTEQSAENQSETINITEENATPEIILENISETINASMELNETIIININETNQSAGITVPEITEEAAKEYAQEEEKGKVIPEEPEDADETVVETIVEDKTTVIMPDEIFDETAVNETVTNITETNISKEKKVKFNNKCTETCLIAEQNQIRITIEVSGGKLYLESITYLYEGENNPPEQIKLIENMTFYGNYTINASEYFIDPENEELSFDSKNIDGITTKVENEIITFESTNAGAYEAYIYAIDSENLARSNTFSIIVGNITNQTNATGCNQRIADGSWFEVKTKEERLMLIDQQGMVFLKGMLKQECDEQYSENDFVLKAKENVAGFLSRETGDLCIRGITDDAMQEPSGSGNFIIKNKQEQVVAYFDSDGNLHSAGITENCQEVPEQ
ncbi:MAG: hypothetical protein V1659_05065 [Candidatus Woesearchaeota archaeon]